MPTDHEKSPAHRRRRPAIRRTAIGRLAAAALIGGLLLGVVGSVDDADPATPGPAVTPVAPRAQPQPPVAPQAQPQLPAAPQATPVTVTVEPSVAGHPVSSRFLGLSFEASALPRVASFADHGDLPRLLRSLGRGVLRFGGVSADTRVAWTDARTPKPPWASRVLTPADFTALARLARSSGWPVILTVGLVHFEPRAAAREVAAAKAALGPWLAGVEIGNEPDAYGRHALRPAPWTFAHFDREVRTYRRAIARIVHGRVPIAGPGVSGSHAFARWGPREAAAERPALLTGHHYPLGCKQVPAPTAEELLSALTRSRERISLGRYMKVSRRTGIPFRMDETGSVSCGGETGVSNTFASALWATAFLVSAMQAGVEGVNLEGNPEYCLGYSPLCATTSERLQRGALSPQPVWYALLLARQLIGERPVHTIVTAPGNPDLAVGAFAGPARTLRLVLVDDDPPGSLPALVALHLPGGYASAEVLALQALSPAATDGVTLGGQRVGAGGAWSPPPTLPTVPVRSGQSSISLAPSSALLVTVRPRQPGIVPPPP
jgi:hypothetical protein